VTARRRRQALWLQDSWKLFAERYAEGWGPLRGLAGRLNGLNVNGSTRVVQPTAHVSRGFSPKGIGRLGWRRRFWKFSASVGQAYRFPTAAGVVPARLDGGRRFTSPDPNLKPDNVVASELSVERVFEKGRVQLTYFQQDVHDAIIAQFLTLVPGKPDAPFLRSRTSTIVMGARARAGVRAQRRASSRDWSFQEA